MGIKGWIGNLKGVTAAVTGGGAGAAGGPVDVGPPTGAQFEPIEGVDLPTYTRVVYGLTTGKITEEGPVLTYVAEQGLDPSTWKTVAEGWNERIIDDLAVKAQFGQLYLSRDAEHPIEGDVNI